MAGEFSDIRHAKTTKWLAPGESTPFYKLDPRHNSEEAEGEKGGCNAGFLGIWGGTGPGPQHNQPLTAPAVTICSDEPLRAARGHARLSRCSTVKAGVER
jgi:hypothetical protein